MNGAARLVLCGALTGALAACVPYVARRVSPERTAASLSARSLADPGLRRFIAEEEHGTASPWPPPSWGFDRLELAAFYYSPDLDVARARLAAAEAAVVTAGERPNPATSVTPEWVSNAAHGVSPWVLGVALDVPVRTAGRRAIRIAEARNLSDAARLRLGGQAWSVRSRLRAALVDLWQAERAANVLERQEATAHERERAVESRLDHGEVALLAVTQARRQWQAAALALAQARQREAEARVGVANALGVPVSALTGITIDFDFAAQLPAAADLVPARVRGAALLDRTDILSALAEYAASEAALRLEVARQYPDLRLGPGYTFDQGEHKWILGVGLTLPVMNRNQGPIAEAEARRREAAARFVALQSQVIGEIDLALAAYRGARAGVTSADALLAAEDAALVTAKTQFAAGETDRVALLTAGVERDTIALATIAARAAAQRALGRLEDAVEKPLVPGTAPPPVDGTGPRPAGEDHP